MGDKRGKALLDAPWEPGTSCPGAEGGGNPGRAGLGRLAQTPQRSRS